MCSDWVGGANWLVIDNINVISKVIYLGLIVGLGNLVDCIDTVEGGKHVRDEVLSVWNLVE